MTRNRWMGIGFVVLLVVVLSILAPTGADENVDPVTYASDADVAYDEGDFKKASAGYRIAFSLYDPKSPAQSDRRAALAMKTVRSLVRWTRALKDDEEYGPQLAELADTWVEEALALDPRAGWAHLERAMLFDAEWAPTKDPGHARFAYRRFLAWVDAGDFEGEPNPPDPEGALVERARKRLAELDG